MIVGPSVMFRSGTLHSGKMVLEIQLVQSQTNGVNGPGLAEESTGRLWTVRRPAIAKGSHG